ncbi:hypothetical protein GOD90_20275 [Sinorhizobium medicae]|nr:hypothetical protein [Sinorhizobium medicae]MDX0899292.1 hypothetical protein [Sinorhizobium medicae]MDX1120226.1 hypothetical protein [Sinorhizobium medicae]MDX1242709.1 hypothetical protein [Sinorhizobium medicae]
MPVCPFAMQMPISGSSGSYTGGPFKIVHHTTEGSTAEGAFRAYRANRSDPHFTVDETGIYQHIDTGRAARALRNPPGGGQTNRDSAIQIEVVGFAHRAKSMATLRNVARLCRWIENTHGVPRTWPNDLPKAAKNGRDPGDHNRNARTWDTRGGHYGHSQVPENTHWDPGYTEQECSFVLEFDFGADEDFLKRFEDIPETDPGLLQDSTQMPDHHEVESELPPGGDDQTAEVEPPQRAAFTLPELDARSAEALDAKIEARTKIGITQELQLEMSSIYEGDAAAERAAEFAIGTFEGLESIRLRWVRPNWFEFIPKRQIPFRFIRANGERVEPRRMFTDGGSIPRLFRWGNGLDPWGFAPAYLLHDYEFDLHRCGRSDKSFEDVRDTMMEAVRTLMHVGLCPSSSVVFGMIYAGIDSIVARRIWNAKTSKCSLPPDSEE